MSAAKALLRRRKGKRSAGDAVDADLRAGAEDQPLGKRGPLHRADPTSRTRLVALVSRAAGARHVGLLEALVRMLPHARKDCKLEGKEKLGAIPEIVELAGGNVALFLEVRKHVDLYLWVGLVPEGPSIKFHVTALRPLDELSLTGNCLCGSRGVVSFGAEFGEGAPAHLRAARELLTRVFAVPEGHPKSKPFVDHCHSFNLDAAGRIQYRHYQLAPPEAGAGQGPVLVEIGPRCALTIIRIFGGAFGGPTLYSNEAFVHPNAVRADLRQRTGDRYARKTGARAQRKAHLAGARRAMPRDELKDVFREEFVVPGGEEA